MSDELLSPRDLALVDAIAERVLERLGERGARPRLVSAGELAAVLGVSRDTVYQHADELGALEVGGGSKPRLRFDVEKALAAWSSRQTSERSQAPDPPRAGRSPRRRQRATGSGPKLLPIGGRKGP